MNSERNTLLFLSPLLFRAILIASGQMVSRSVIHSPSHKSLIPSQICPLSSNAYSHLDGKIQIGFSVDKKEEGEISRGEADNFWHESHKTLRGEQIINSNSTKKMAAAEPPPPLDAGDAVATNSPLSLFSAFPTQSLKICMYICGAATSLTHGEKEKEISLSLPRSPRRVLGAPWKM